MVEIVEVSLVVDHPIDSTYDICGFYTENDYYTRCVVHKGTFTQGDLAIFIPAGTKMHKRWPNIWNVTRYCSHIEGDNENIIVPNFDFDGVVSDGLLIYYNHESGQDFRPEDIGVLQDTQET